MASRIGLSDWNPPCQEVADFSVRQQHGMIPMTLSTKSWNGFNRNIGLLFCSCSVKDEVFDPRIIEYEKPVITYVPSFLLCAPMKAAACYHG
jgi:hypothetical protein